MHLLKVCLRRRFRFQIYSLGYREEDKAMPIQIRLPEHLLQIDLEQVIVINKGIRRIKCSFNL